MKMKLKTKSKKPLTNKDVLNQLKGVIDPELGFNIVDLGLIYGVKVIPLGSGIKVKVTMTLTSPGCPLAPIIHGEVERVMMELPQVQDVELELVWDPPWTMEMMSKEIKLTMGVI